MGKRIKEVDAYIGRAREFARPILEHLRELFHRACPDIEESMKWSAPHFVKNGIVGSMASFKKHVSLGFWKGQELSALSGLLDRIGTTQMAAFRVSAVDELPADRKLIACMREAAALNERLAQQPRPVSSASRKSAAAKAKPKLEPPADLAAALAKNKKATKVFEGFSRSNRKEYIEWLTEAKREETRKRRLATAIEWLAEGKPRNWKYMKEWK